MPRRSAFPRRRVGWRPGSEGTPMAREGDALFEEHDAIGIATKVRRGDVSAEEVLAVALARIARVEPHVQALSRSVLVPPPSKSDGHFLGVPFVVKDLMVDCFGSPTSAGAAFFAQEPAAIADSAA